MEIKRDFNFMERVMLQHAYIPKLVTDCLGIVLGLFFLWNQNLIFGLLCLFGMSILGSVIAWKQNVHQLARTKLGRWMLIQANPINLIVRTVGFGVLCYGVWLHSTVVIVIGCFIVITGRLLSKKFG